MIYNRFCSKYLRNVFFQQICVTNFKSNTKTNKKKKIQNKKCLSPYLYDIISLSSKIYIFFCLFNCVK